ncbi:LysR family transcriptional regulator [Streptomyces luteireticuli]|uniref:LysR family transcriptional regulator n=1 Tax=Streptomyces luteireticuli TaxID=173858 RepID=UPI003556E714
MCRDGEVERVRCDEEPSLALSGLLRRLEYFVVVADELHLGRAALRCGVSQPTLSHQMKVLEQELGAQLLSRDNRRLSLTLPGEELREEAPGLLRRTYAIRGRIKDAAAGRARPVRVAFSGSGHALRQREMVAEFRAREGVPVSVESGWSARNAELVRAGRVDLAFVRPPLGADGLCVTVVGEEELVQLRPGGASPADADLPLVMWPRPLAPGLHDRIMDVARQDGGSSRPLREEPDDVNVAAAVASGAGVAYLDRGVAEWLGRGADLRIRPLGPPAPRTEIAVVRRAGPDEDVALRFVAACRRIGNGRASNTPAIEER